ncbi:WAT1-related protein [Trema orientale]|uniref:WAT1-related protein n=1 Tax=Trema orientale TaxID=63057 RepID=A0A2P5AWC0_TREOI|nr:WAT1-related protein [Trema orientale]
MKWQVEAPYHVAFIDGDMVLNKIIYYVAFCRSDVVATTYHVAYGASDVLIRMEKLDVSKHGFQTKIGGTIVSFAGATIMTLYKGINVISIHGQTANNQSFSTPKLSFHKDWKKGSAILVASYLSLAALYILQPPTISRQPSPPRFVAGRQKMSRSKIPAIVDIFDHRSFIGTPFVTSKYHRSDVDNSWTICNSVGKE